MVSTESPDSPSRGEFLGVVNGLTRALGPPQIAITDSLQIVRAVADFANGDTSPDVESRLQGHLHARGLMFCDAREILYSENEWAYDENGNPEAMYRYIIPGWDKDFGACPNEITKSRARDIENAWVEEKRKEAASIFELALSNPSVLCQRAVNNQWIPQVTTRQVITPLADDRVAIENQLSGPVTEDGWIVHVAALFAADHDGIRSLLARCKLDTCRHFFLGKPKGRGTGPGKRNRMYCRPEHMMLAHQKDSPRRRREALKKRRAQTPKPRRRSSK